MTTRATGRPAGRLYYLDNLRIYLTVLVIVHHASIAYGGGGDWAVSDPGVDEISPILLTYFTAVNQSYFMSAFFLLAGYFTPYALARKGAGPFLRDRLIRLGVPILVYSTLIINLNQVLTGVWMRAQPFHWIVAYETGHLWFLQALLLFAVVYVLYRAVMDRGGVQRRLQFYADRLPSDGVLVVCIVLLAALTFLVRTRFAIGAWVFPGFQLAHFVHYIFSFYVGILAYGGQWFGRIGRGRAHRWGLLGLIVLPLFFVVAVLGGALEGDAGMARFLGGGHWQSAAISLWESVLLIAALIFLLYFFRERVQGTSSLLRALAASVFAAYIIHQTVVIGLHVLFLPVAIPTILKFVVVSAIAVPVCFGLAILIRRIPLVRPVLG